MPPPANRRKGGAFRAAVPLVPRSLFMLPVAEAKKDAVALFQFPIWLVVFQTPFFFHLLPTCEESIFLIFLKSQDVSMHLNVR